LKIVFSRKGFDSGYGGCPSPIFPDGQLLSLPIPGGYAPWRYDAIQGPQGPLGPMVTDLTGQPMLGRAMVHLDPDLDAGSVPRRDGWRPSLGQAGAAQSHLASQGVGPGDLLLFFGWFRPVEHAAGKWRPVRGAPAVHALFGYLQIGQSLAIGGDVTGHGAWAISHPWLHDHPHLHGERSANNTIHVASDRLVLPDGPTALPGGGAFRQWTPDLTLTAPGQSAKSLWQLPGWLGPDATGKGRLSYHGDPARWTRTPEGQVRLQTVAKGQEFVVDIGDDPEALAWVRQMCQRPLRGAVAVPEVTSVPRRPRRGP
jgi:hypothetical protein